MRDARIEKLAHLLVTYSLEVKSGQKVLIKGSEVTAPLIKACYKEIIKAGGHPEVDVLLTGLDEILLKEGSDTQLEYISQRDMAVVESYDALLVIWGGSNTKPLANVDSERITLKRRARAPWMTAFSKRCGEGTMRWVGTQFPTHSDAQEAGMSLDEYEEFVFGAGFMNDEHPVKQWRERSKRQQKICEFLQKKTELRYVAKDTDITFGIQGRIWMNCDGHRNFPDGEVFTTPLRDQVNGHIAYSFPGIYSGKEVEGIKLTFKDGKVVKASAEKGEELLLSLLDTDEGARYVGEVAIGTNYGIQGFTHNTLFDEKIGGTVHVAIGSGFPATGGNNESGIHWDMICDMRDGGEIYADGECIYKNGEFLLTF